LLSPDVKMYYTWQILHSFFYVYTVSFNLLTLLLLLYEEHRPLLIFEQELNVTRVCVNVSNCTGKKYC
jgi:hypothetical protein